MVQAGDVYRRDFFISPTTMNRAGEGKLLKVFFSTLFGDSTGFNTKK